MTREEVLKGVLKNYARFYLRKTFLEYPWIRDRFKRRYMLGCLKAFAKNTATKSSTTRALEGQRPDAQVDLGFDRARCSVPRSSRRSRSRARSRRGHRFQGTRPGDGLRGGEGVHHGADG